MPRPPDARSNRFWELQDFSQGHGLEIGPLHRPILFPDEARVQYADVFDADYLREFYTSHAQVITEDIPEIDFVLLQDGVVRNLPRQQRPTPRTTGSSPHTSSSTYPT